MKKINFLAFAACTLSFSIVRAQGVQTDSTTMGAGYSNQIFYSMKSGIIGNSPVSNWDIAHATDQRSSCIRANHMTGLRVFSYPKNTNAGWSTFDTSGWSAWRERYNDIHDHDKGAFSLTSSHPTYDWGSYNSSSHEIIGDSLFLLAWTDGTNWVKFLKFWPVRQTATSDFIFKYANVDGSNEVLDTLYQNQSANQNYKYFKFDKTKAVREPAKTSWDITFNRYYEPIPAGPGMIVMYPVMGVETNRTGVKVAKIIGPTNSTTLTDTANLVSTYGMSANSDLSAIGSNWKFFDNNQFKWFLSDTSSYIVRSEHTQDSTWWLIQFSTFSGSSNAKTVFNKVKLQNSASYFSPNLGSVNIFPNPASKDVFVSFEKSTNQPVSIVLMGINGNTVFHNSVQPNGDLSAYRIPVDQLKSGIYVISLTSGNQNIQHKIVIE